MEVIDINGAAAREQATNICNSNDELSINKSVTFSSSTTVTGNESSQTTFEVLKGTGPMIQQLLSRDVANIHSAVEAFERADKKSADLLDLFTLG